MGPNDLSIRYSKLDIKYLELCHYKIFCMAMSKGGLGTEHILNWPSKSYHRCTHIVTTQRSSGIAKLKVA